MMWKANDPYQMHQKWHTGVSEDDIAHDAAAQRFRLILRSRQARWVPLTKAPWAIAMSYVLVLFWWFIKPPRFWSVDFEEAVVAAGFWSLSALMFYMHAQLRWAVRLWSETDARPCS
jgi:hypothetical protein